MLTVGKWALIGRDKQWHQQCGLSSAGNAIWIAGDQHNLWPELPFSIFHFSLFVDVRAKQKAKAIEKHSKSNGKYETALVCEHVPLHPLSLNPFFPPFCIIPTYLRSPCACERCVCVCVNAAISAEASEVSKCACQKQEMHRERERERGRANEMHFHG